MTKLKQQIIKEINALKNPGILGQVFDFLRLIRRMDPKPKSNRSAVLSLAGSISNEEAEEMQKIIDQEFNNIEGEW